MIAYIRAWQNALSEHVSNDVLMAFNMNSYIIAVLVIFYLQVNHDVPTVTELRSTVEKGIKFSAKQSFGTFLKEFFEFYGKTYETKMHLISVFIGKWQQKQLGEQKHFTAEQKRFVFSNRNHKTMINWHFFVFENVFYSD